MLSRAVLRRRGAGGFKAMELASVLNVGNRCSPGILRRFPHHRNQLACFSRVSRRAPSPGDAFGASLSVSRRKLCNAPQAAVAAPAPKIGANPDVVKELGFEEVREEFISEYKSTAVLYRHKKTGAEVMSVVNEDENKVFGIVFRTPPKDSKGIPHILEHSVLCGSRKYPLKEPFVELLKGSLHTFLNAFTYPDRTCYPVASTNLKDFYNLVDVYLDAVFHPRCVSDPQIFQQEGWHYEVNDSSEDLTYKGVVFNEMKGVYSQPDSVLGRICQQELFPNNAYNVDSGGDPSVIPDLTFEEFQEFHRKFYHPSNARIWFYGDDDPTERLRIVNAYLSNFEANNSAAESEVKPQSLLSEPKKIKEKYAVGEETDTSKKHMVSMNWLLSDKPLDLETELALGFLDHLVLGTPAAPLRKTLLESHLGEALTSSGVEDDLLQPQFSIGMKGVAESDIPAVEELIVSTLQKLADEGFTSEAVEASMNTIEFALRENNTGSFPRGLSLMLRSMGKWLYGRDPFEPLRFAKPLEDLKAKIATEGAKAVFSPLIQNFLLSNKHLVTVELQPDAEKSAEIEALEKERLAKVKASLAKQELEELARATEELKKRQETPDPPEALKAVPSLSLSDIPKEPIHVPIAIGEMHGATMLRHDIFTNDVLYAEVAFELRTVPSELLPLVPLFCQSLLEMGTKDMDFVSLNLLIGRKTGGISVYPSTSSVRGKKEPSSKMIIRGKAMASQAQDLFSLMRTILQDVQFTDKERFKQFVSQSKSGMESRLRGAGHRIVASRLDAMLNIPGAVGEKMGGLSYLDYLRELEKQVDTDWPAVQQNLERIRTSFLSRKGAIVNLTADEKNLTKADSFVSSLLEALPETEPVVCTWNGILQPCNEGIIVPTQVNYVGKAANLYDTGYELDGSAYVISKYIGNTWLWDRVRVSGGAYGGFCDFDSHSGVFTYLSYRDPNLAKTIDNYDLTVQFLRELELDDDALTKAIIGTIGDVDSYQLPDAKGYSSMLRYILGITEEERKLRREQILSTSLRDFKAFADVLEHVKEKGIVAAVASAEDVESANKERPGLLQPKKVSL
ncbi:presequence protease 1, chloroplastic/mitochondrial [Selaginella moellendorffii]|uniref:presequence protease 1, chloroplastic/mitochondrial n=1 Tax=Selaginella moellendorffii TaxID=88036 RepID=UPI000D1CC03C|nr:presequence protease 1, chloroplastic/mitochondrial [Selaginella moellendorffii]|eukprot:XP_024540313.1 presequence protease 1, chloroplastic/mitochondrial [Selaginella moellendorffii]